MARFVIAGLLIAFVLASTQAQQAGCLERTIPVSISSNDGSLAPELTIANLEGTYDKKPVTVKAVVLAEKRPRVILLIDTSGSMQLRVNAIVDSAEKVLEALPFDTMVGLAFFQSQTMPVEIPNDDRKSLLLQMEALRKSPQSFRGRTALRAAVLVGVKMLGTPALGDSLYLISDGADNQSKTEEGEMERQLENSGIRLFVLMLGGGITARNTLEEVAGPTLLNDATHNTGGTAIGAVVVPYMRVDFVKKDGTSTQLGQNLKQQIRQIVNFYRVDVTLPQAVDKPRALRLELTGFDKSRQRTLTLSYPNTVFPCQ